MQAVSLDDSVVALHQPRVPVPATASPLPLLSPKRHVTSGTDLFTDTALVRRAHAGSGNEATGAARTGGGPEGQALGSARQGRRKRHSKRGRSGQGATPHILPLSLAVTLGYASRWHRVACTTASGASYYGQTTVGTSAADPSAPPPTPGAGIGGSRTQRVPDGYGVESLAPDLVFAGHFVRGRRVRGAFVLPATAEELRVEAHSKPHRRIGGPCLLSTSRTQERDGSLRLLPALSVLHVTTTVLCVAMALEALIALRVWVAGGIVLVVVVAGLVVGWRSGRLLGDARLSFLGMLHAAVPFLARRLAGDKALDGVRVDTLGGPPRPGVSAVVYMCVTAPSRTHRAVADACEHTRTHCSLSAHVAPGSCDAVTTVTVHWHTVAHWHSLAVPR